MSERRAGALRDLERRSTQEAVQRLMDGDLVGSQTAFERAELAKGLLTHLQEGSWAQFIVPLVVALLCGAVASFLAVYRIPSASLSAQISCTSTSFVTAESLEWKGNLTASAGAFRFEKYYAALAPLEPDEKPGPDSGRGSLDLSDGGHAALKAVTFEQGTTVAVEVDRTGQLQLFTRHGRVDAQTVFWGRVGVELEAEGEVQAETMDVEVPESLYLYRTDRGIVPSLLQLDAKEDFQLTIAEVLGVSFSKEILENGASKFQSSVLEGELVVLDTDEEARIGPNQSLTLVNFRGQIRRLVAGDVIELGLTGTADDIVISSGNIRRSLVPSYLGFMYQNQQLALVWSVVAFLWGMLWSVGRFVTRRS